jgi:nucleoside-diphosphate-sugar epimerase
MKKKIVLIGSNGFFGKNIINFFEKKYIIKKIYRKDSIKKINFKNYHFIINAAADVYNEENMFQNNTGLVLDILNKIVKENRGIRLIHFGSSGEYGAVNKKSKEEDLIAPRTVYEATKAAASMLVQGYAKNFKIKSLIIRPFSIYGLHENKTRIMPNIFRHFLIQQKLNIYDGFHDYVYIEDLILFLNKLIMNNRVKNYGEIVNFGSGKQFSNLKILSFCEKVFKKKSKARYIPGFKKIYDKKIWCSNNTYLLKKFKFKFKYSIQKGIQDYLKKYNINEII